MGCAAAGEEQTNTRSDEAPKELEMPVENTQYNDAPDAIEPVLPKLVIYDSKPKVQPNYHDLLTEEPETVENPPYDTAKLVYPSIQQSANSTMNTTHNLVGNYETAQLPSVQPRSYDSKIEADAQAAYKRKVKKIIRPKKTAEYEFNDNEDAQRVTVKGKGVFDQIERDYFYEIKHQALQRPGSAGVKKNASADIDAY